MKLENKFTKKYMPLVFVGLLLCLSTISIHYHGIDSMASTPEDSNQELFRISDIFTTGYDEVSGSPYYTYDHILERLVLSLDFFDVSGNLLTLQLDPRTGMPVFYLDTQTSTLESSSFASDENVVWATINRFLNKIRALGHAPISPDMVFRGLSRTQSGWRAEWVQEIKDIRIDRNFISISVEPNGSQVVSYTNRRDASAADSIAIAYGEIEDLAYKKTAKYLTYQSDILYRWLRIDHSYRLAAGFHIGKLTHWFDMQTDKLIHIDYPMGYETSQVMDGSWGPQGWTRSEDTYTCAKSIYWRLDSSTTDADPSRYYEDADVEKEDVLARLNSDVIFIHIGHGTTKEEGNQKYSGFSTYTERFEDLEGLFPDDISSYNLNSMKFVYIGSCRSFISGSGYTQSICQEFLDRGANCVFGWTADVDAEKAKEYARYFFDYAVNGKSLWQSYQYANGKSEQSVVDMAKLDWTGDYRYHIIPEDDAGDTNSGPYDFGSGTGSPETIWQCHEGLWGPDCDWFTFEVTYATYRVDIWVDVLWGHGLDGRIDVYDSNFNIIDWADDNGVGYDEHIDTFYATPQHYFVKVSHNEATNPHGGDYVLHIKIFS
jgi:hypothetical protein